MKIREHAFLWDLQRSRPKVKPPHEVAEICRDCAGRCKADKGLVYCPGKEKWNGAKIR